MINTINTIIKHYTRIVIDYKLGEKPSDLADLRQKIQDQYHLKKLPRIENLLTIEKKGADGKTYFISRVILFGEKDSE